jgi:hypothetical protein
MSDEALNGRICKILKSRVKGEFGSSELPEPEGNTRVSSDGRIGSRSGAHMSLRVVLVLLVYLMLPTSGSAAGADDKTVYDQRAAARYVALFQSLDRDGDGTVTRVEAQGDLNLGPVFDDMDINRDGIVTSAELQRYIEQRYGVHAAR